MSVYDPASAPKPLPSYHQQALELVVTASTRGEGWAKQALDITQIPQTLQQNLLDSLDEVIAEVRDAGQIEGYDSLTFFYKNLEKSFIYNFFFQQVRVYYEDSITECLKCVGAAVYAFSHTNRNYHQIGINETTVRARLAIYQEKNRLRYVIPFFFYPPLRIHGDQIIKFAPTTTRNKLWSLAKLINGKVNEFAKREDVLVDFKNVITAPMGRAFVNQIFDDVRAYAEAGKIENNSHYFKIPKACIATNYRLISNYENYVPPSIAEQKMNVEAEEEKSESVHLQQQQHQLLPNLEQSTPEQNNQSIRPNPNRFFAQNQNDASNTQTTNLLEDIRYLRDQLKKANERNAANEVIFLHILLESYNKVCIV